MNNNEIINITIVVKNDIAIIDALLEVLNKEYEVIEEISGVLLDTAIIGLKIQRK